MRLPFWVFGLLAAFIGIQALRFQNRGLKLADTEKELADSTNALKLVRADNRTLTTANTSLSIAVADLRADNATLKSQRDQYKADALSAAIKLNQKNAELVRVSRLLTAVQAKQAADEYVGGIGAINTTVGDSVLNQNVAALKSQLKNALQTADDQQVVIARLEGEKSDLEAALNGTNVELLREKQKQAENVAYVQELRGKAMKGLGKLFRAGQVKALGKVDQKLRE